MRVGILGGGQLGWMTILEGRKLGYEFYVLDKNPNAPASKLADRWFPPEKAEEFSELCDVITYEFEHIDDEVLQSLKRDTKPPLEVLRLKRSRISEKNYLSSMGYPVAEYRVISAKQIPEVCIDKPYVAKAERLGYDGKGQYILRNSEDIDKLTSNHEPEDLFILEEFIDFVAEVSCVGVRDAFGNVKLYPVSFNYHRGGILLYNYAPYDLEASMLKDIQDTVSQLMEDMDITGLLAVEFFITTSGKVLINEFAPRPHNTGHYTLEASYTSQFENLLRAITSLPVGETSLKLPGGMVNILGLSLEDISLEDILSIPGARLYWYGKEKRKGRKMGHINVTAPSVQILTNRLKDTLEIVYAQSETTGKA